MSRRYSSTPSIRLISVFTVFGRLLAEYSPLSTDLRSPSHPAWNISIEGCVSRGIAYRCCLLAPDPRSVSRSLVFAVWKSRGEYPGTCSDESSGVATRGTISLHTHNAIGSTGDSAYVTAGLRARVPREQHGTQLTCLLKILSHPSIEMFSRGLRLSARGVFSLFGPSLGSASEVSRHDYFPP